MKKLKKLTMTLALLITAATGAWAQEVTPLITIESTGDNASFKSGSMTFDDKVTVTFSNTVKNYGDAWGWYCDSSESLLTVAGINGNTITSCKFYAGDGTADYTVEGESPSVYLSGSKVYTDDSKSVEIGSHGVTKIEVYGAAAPAGPEVTWDATTKQATFEMPAYDVELMVEYYPGKLSFGGDAIEGGTVEVVGLTGDALPAGFEKDAEGNIYVAQGTTFTVKATPEEGYHFVCWSDDQNNTNPEREITMPADGSDLSLTATFAENQYDITFSEGTNPDPENPEWTATPNPAKTKQTVTVTYTGSKKVIGVKAEKKAPLALNLTSPAVGQVIGDDGKNYDYASLPQGVTAVAKICYVSGSNGLALALTDENGKMNWSTAISTCAAHTPAFTGGTWKLATQDEWNNMITAAGSYTDLRDGFSSVGGSNLQLYSNYWSSTEGIQSNLASYYDFYNGDWYNGNKVNGYRARACLAF